MINQITNDHIREVAELAKEMEGTRYWPRKREKFKQLTAKLSEEASWLVQWASYFSCFNSRWKAIDVSRFYVVRLSDTNESTFQSFLEMLQYYRLRSVCKSTEWRLIEFIKTCDKYYFDFYCLLLEKSFHRNMPLTDLQAFFDLDEISPQDIYGNFQHLKTGFSELSFPISINKISDPEAMFLISTKEPTSEHIFNRTLIEGKLKRISDDKLAKADKAYIKYPTYTLVGYIDKAHEEMPVKSIRQKKLYMNNKKLVPVDFFPSWEDYKKKQPKFEHRINMLNDFIGLNFTTKIQGNLVGFARNEAEIGPEVKRLFADGESTSYLLLADDKTAFNNSFHTVYCAKTTAIIEGYWVEDGVPLGFICWHNGRKNKVHFDFSGKMNSLLNDEKLVYHKVLSVIYVDCGETKVYYGVEVLWSKAMWRLMVMPNGAYLEKCAICGDDSFKHNRRGVCSGCEKNLYHYWDRNEVGTWITLGHGFRAKRKRSGWEPSMMNSIRYTMRGTLVISDTQGNLMFQPDEQAEREYQENLKKTNRKLFTSKEDNGSNNDIKPES